MKVFKVFYFILVLFLFDSLSLSAQQAPHPQVSDEELKRANDPMANIKAFNIQNYIVSKLYGTEGHINQLHLRYSKPIGKLLLRGTMPLIASSAGQGVGPTTGFGDFNLFAIYSFPSPAGNKFGIGPNITAPTGSHN